MTNAGSEMCNIRLSSANEWILHCLSTYFMNIGNIKECVSQTFIVGWLLIFLFGIFFVRDCIALLNRFSLKL